MMEAGYAAFLEATAGAAGVVVDGVRYARDAAGVWHVLTAQEAPALGYELLGHLQSSASEPPTWFGDALVRLARDLEPKPELLRHGVRIGPPYFKQPQRLVPVAVHETIGGRVVEVFGLFLEEAERVMHDLEACRALVEHYRCVTTIREPTPPAYKGLTSTLSGFVATACTDMQARIAELTRLRRTDVEVDAVMSDRHADMCVGITTVIDTVEGPAWQVLGVSSFGLDLSLRSRCDGERLLPERVRQDWLRLLRIIAANDMPGVNEPVQTPVVLFADGDREAGCFILLDDRVLAHPDRDLFVVVPLFDDEYDCFVRGDTTIAALVAGLNTVTPAQLARLDRPAAAGAPSSPTLRAVRLSSLEADDDDEGPFLMIDPAQARTVATALTALVDDASRVKLLGSDVDVELAVTSGAPAVVREREFLRVSGRASDWQAAAAALAAGVDVEHPVRINIG